MAKKVHKPEKIVSKRSQVDVLHKQGVSMADATRRTSVSEFTFYRWRKGYGDMKANLVCSPKTDPSSLSESGYFMSLPRG